MSAFFHLLVHILPLYGLILLGFCAGRFLKVDRLSLANLAIFICMPVVMFGFVARLDFQLSYLVLALIYFTFSVFIGLVFLAVGRRVYPDHRANLLALITAQNNSGYFGLPVMLLIFEARWVAVYMIIMLGGVLFEASFAYYIAARGAFDARESLRRLARFPAIYAVPLGFAVNAGDAVLPGLFWTYWEYFKGAYVILGMMIIGCALSTLRHLKFSLRFNVLAFLGKFVLWPAVAVSFVLVESYTYGALAPEIRAMFILLSLMPPAANVTAFAAAFNTDPEKAATTVLAGTILSLFLIPAAIIMLKLAGG